MPLPAPGTDRRRRLNWKDRYDKQRDLLRDAMRRYPAAQVIAATDADEAGVAMAARIVQLAPDRVTRHRPPGLHKDWNDALLGACRERQRHLLSTPTACASAALMPARILPNALRGIKMFAGRPWTALVYGAPGRGASRRDAQKTMKKTGKFDA